MFSSRIVTGLFTILGAAAWPSIGHSQHHHHGGGHGHGHSHHHGSHFGHSNWNYVVPHHHHHRGSYYVQDNSYYYTPSPITRIASGHPAPHVVQRPIEPVQLRFGGFAQQEDLAGRLEIAANLLCRDMHSNYQHNTGFAGTYREAYEIWNTVRYMHEREHAGDHEAVRRQVQNLDRAFHHVQEEIRPWTAHAHRQIGFGGMNEKTSEMEAVLHHLCYDVGVKPEHGAEAPPAASSDEVAPPPTASVPQ